MFTRHHKYCNNIRLCFLSTRYICQQLYFELCTALAFSLLIVKAASGGFLSGYYKIMGGNDEEVQITHLLFTMTCFLLKFWGKQIAYLNQILVWFELSVLRINLEKSSTLHEERVENQEGLALELSCKIGSLSTTYLGLPLEAPHNSTIV